MAINRFVGDWRLFFLPVSSTRYNIKIKDVPAGSNYKVSIDIELTPGPPAQIVTVDGFTLGRHIAFSVRLNSTDYHFLGKIFDIPSAQPARIHGHYHITNGASASAGIPSEGDWTSVRPPADLT